MPPMLMKASPTRLVFILISMSRRGRIFHSGPFMKSPKYRIAGTLRRPTGTLGSHTSISCKCPWAAMGGRHAARKTSRFVGWEAR